MNILSISITIYIYIYITVTDMTLSLFGEALPQTIFLKFKTINSVTHTVSYLVLNNN